MANSLSLNPAQNKLRKLNSILPMTISYSAIAKFTKDKEQDQQDQVSLRNKLQHNIYLVTEQNSFKVIFKYVNRVVLLAHLLKEL